LQRIQTEMDRYLLEHDAPEEIIGFLHHHWARLLTGILALYEIEWVAQFIVRPSEGTRNPIFRTGSRPC
jgi:hypothetical protein